MSLTSQIITADFPDLDKVEALNNEAFPEEERIPLSEFLRYEEQEDANFFAFYHEKEFVGFAFAISNAQAFYVSFFAIMPHLRSHAYGGEIIEKLVNFYQRTMILEIERLDEPCDNLEQRQARWDFYHSKAKSPVSKYAARVFAQSVATAHMRGHAIVSADYAVKVVNLLSPADIVAVRKEREKQMALAIKWQKSAEIEKKD